MSEEELKKMEERLSKLEINDALSLQSRRNLHQQIEALGGKLDSLLEKIDGFLDNCALHKTSTALIRQEVDTLKGELSDLAEDVKWALRLAITSLLGVAGALIFYILTSAR